MLLVAIPVLGRPHRAATIAASVHDNTTLPHRLVFVCTEGDDDQIRACVEALGDDDGVLFIDAGHTGEYARKINLAFQAGDEPFVFLGADDLEFQPGWDVAALEVADQTGAGVVGTNDQANSAVIAGLHSTHSLVRRSYIDECGGFVRGEGSVYFEGYSHQFVDNELVATAMARGCYAHAHRSRVIHLHPLWRTAPMDGTYERALADGATDRLLFESRRGLWENGARVV